MKILLEEVEARNVQSRMGMTAKERLLKKPVSTEDVPRAKQIVRMEGGKPTKYTTIDKTPESKKVIKTLNKKK